MLVQKPDGSTQKHRIRDEADGLSLGIVLAKLLPGHVNGD
jgi:hypothetical protein